MGEQNLTISEHYHEVRGKYPKLGLPRKNNGFWKIDGTIDVIDDEGSHWDSYEVSIFLSPNYPKDLPVLIETSKKIRRHIDWHISDEGICCLSTPSKMYQALGEEITLLKWLNEFAHPYLANHVTESKQAIMRI